MVKPHVSKGKQLIHSSSSRSRNYKPFHKVFGNVHEGQGYADKRKRKIINQYRKIRKHMLKEKKESSQQMHDEKTDKTRTVKEETSPKFKQPRKEAVSIIKEKKTKRTDGNRKSKLTRFSKVEMEFKQQKLIKEKQAQEAQKIREEKKAALDRYKSSKRARHKKLSQKSKKGQPIMKYHVEHLLKKIKSDKL
ncbi:thyroid transcription factor 1-associated protein 26 homolog isoform X1 [Anneissia japonica]|uniref:thyroid transcription factor 1-associated protein 26 homolog isoform X1 n=1 Tax=Anneissia japonica TaxID=1529436 RepID=UPI001425817A|nr:thyroid transcription factor 1-associated protein 26 homolog isoform X1 [Anneissia japonica]